ncbi:MAG: zinc ribbon domain-containing protein [Solobacterium sp.]|nr:zinc ribbon domain-containing protein [Solobacterium sp.]
MDFGKDYSKTFRLGTASVQNVAYALSEFLDTKKNMITQTMRTKNGYTVQCKGDANAEWSKYIGLDAAITVNLIPMEGDLIVEIGTGKWMEKLGIAALGSIFFQPLLITSGIGAIRQVTLPNDIFAFIGDYLGSEPIEVSRNTVREVKDCPVCGKENSADAVFCSSCGTKFEEPQEPAVEPQPAACPVCGKELSGEETFCPLCGTRLKN